MIYFKHGLSTSQSPIGIVEANSEEDAAQNLGLEKNPKDSDCNWHCSLLDDPETIPEFNPSFWLVEIQEVSSTNQFKDLLIDLELLKK